MRIEKTPAGNRYQMTAHGTILAYGDSPESLLAQIVTDARVAIERHAMEIESTAGAYSARRKFDELRTRAKPIAEMTPAQRGDYFAAYVRAHDFEAYYDGTHIVALGRRWNRIANDIASIRHFLGY